MGIKMTGNIEKGEIMKRISGCLMVMILGLMGPSLVFGQDCPPYLVEVNGICVDPMTDERFCGASPGNPTSGTECSSGEVCISGACVIVCPSGQVECNGLCVLLDRDEDNCGQCGIVCPPRSLCENGNCVPCEPVSSDSFSWGMIKARYR